MNEMPLYIAIAFIAGIIMSQVVVFLINRFFPSRPKFVGKVTEGNRGKWRFSIKNSDTRQTVALSTVSGYNTEEECVSVMRTLFGKEVLIE